MEVFEENTALYLSVLEFIEYFKETIKHTGVEPASPGYEPDGLSASPMHDRG